MISCVICGQQMLVLDDKLCSTCKSEIESQDEHSKYPNQMKLNILYDDVDPVKVDEINLILKDLEQVISHLSRLRDVHKYVIRMDDGQGADVIHDLRVVGELTELIKKLEVG